MCSISFLFLSFFLCILSVDLITAQSHWSYRYCGAVLVVVVVMFFLCCFECMYMSSLFSMHLDKAVLSSGKVACSFFV